MSAQRFTVSAWLNTTRDGVFDGYAGSHPLATAADLTFVLEAATPELAADLAWAVGQRIMPDAAGASWPADVRQLCVGDLLVVAGDGTSRVCVAVDRIGFRNVPEPCNPRVPLAGQGRLTSRE